MEHNSPPLRPELLAIHKKNWERNKPAYKFLAYYDTIENDLNHWIQKTNLIIDGYCHIDYPGRDQKLPVLRDLQRTGIKIIYLYGKTHKWLTDQVYSIMEQL